MFFYSQSTWSTNINAVLFSCAFSIASFIPQQILLWHRNTFLQSGIFKKVHYFNLSFPHESFRQNSLSVSYFSFLIFLVSSVSEIGLTKICPCGYDAVVTVLERVEQNEMRFVLNVSSHVLKAQTWISLNCLITHYLHPLISRSRASSCMISSLTPMKLSTSLKKRRTEGRRTLDREDDTLTSWRRWVRGWGLKWSEMDSTDNVFWVISILEEENMS